MPHTQVQQDWVYKNACIRNFPNTRMVNITDAWKAEGKPTRYRPDKWVRSKSVQEVLSGFAMPLGDLVVRDENARIIGLPGFLEIFKGGCNVTLQGTFVSYDLAISYFKEVSIELLTWFTHLIGADIEGSSEFEAKEGLAFPVTIDDFDGNVRFTPDGRISVYDAIAYITGDTNPRITWNRLRESFPEVVAKCYNLQFPGSGQRPTPVATLQVFLEILVLLPGRLALAVREEAIRTLIRAMKGDPSLVEEILGRIHNPQDLQDLENSVKARRVNAYGVSTAPLGTMDNPITQITRDIKDSLNWVSRAEQMTDLLTDLATHRGMYILRESNHRAYSSTAKDKSRRIDLVLRTVDDFQTVHVYQFETSCIDDTHVAQFWSKRYPEIAYRDFVKPGSLVKRVIAHLVSPAGITLSGLETLKDIQLTLDQKYYGQIKLDAMRLDEFVWGEMYPAIEERYRDTQGKFGGLHLNTRIKKICTKLCESPKKHVSLLSGTSLSSSKFEQLTLFCLDNFAN